MQLLSKVYLQKRINTQVGQLFFSLHFNFTENFNSVLNSNKSLFL